MNLGVPTLREHHPLRVSGSTAPQILCHRLCAATLPTLSSSHPDIKGGMCLWDQYYRGQEPFLVHHHLYTFSMLGFICKLVRPCCPGVWSDKVTAALKVCVEAAVLTVQQVTCRCDWASATQETTWSRLRFPREKEFWLKTETQSASPAGWPDVWILDVSPPNIIWANSLSYICSHIYIYMSIRMWIHTHIHTQFPWRTLTNTHLSISSVVRKVASAQIYTSQFLPCKISPICMDILTMWLILVEFSLGVVIRLHKDNPVSVKKIAQTT